MLLNLNKFLYLIYKGLEYPQIFGNLWLPGTNLLQILRVDCNF